MTDSLLVRNGRILDPADSFDAIGDVLVADGRIVQRGGRVEQAPADTSVIDAAGHVVSPGFVDLHTHLRFPGFSDKETMETGTAAAAAGGFTTVCAMANTRPVVDDVTILRDVHQEAERNGCVRVKQLASVTLGLMGERLTNIEALARAGAVAFSDDGKPVRDSNIMRQALVETASFDKPISVHEEDPATVGAGVANAGPVASRLGLLGWPCEGEASMVRRDVALLAEVGGYLHVAHVSCAQSVDAIRTGRDLGLRLTAEVTPHHLCLTDGLLEGDERLGLPAAHPNTKVNPPVRSQHDVEIVVEALADGTIGAIATDHAPHAEADKALPYEQAAYGFSGIETALPLVLGLVRSGRLSLSTVIERLTAGPARIFSLDAGTLAPNAPADICIFDPNRSWTLTPESMRSKGKNTPLLGAELTGRVIWTIVGGKVVHDLSA